VVVVVVVVVAVLVAVLVLVAIVVEVVLVVVWQHCLGSIIFRDHKREFLSWILAVVRRVPLVVAGARSCSRGVLSTRSPQLYRDHSV
jgi:energy-converting hydrogenase Eha subunit A